MELPDIVFKKADYVETASGNKVCRQTVLCGSQNIILQGKTIVQTDAIIRGDLANVRVGRYSIISNRAVIRPPFKKFSKGKYIFELSMADYIGAAIFLQGIHPSVSGRPLSHFIRFHELPNYLKLMEELYNWRSKPCFFPRAAIAVAFFPIHIGEHTFVGEGSVVSAAVVGSYVYIGKNCVIGRRCVLKDCCMVMDNTVLPPEAVVPSFTKWSGSPGRLDPSGDLPECTQDMMANFTHSYYDHFIPEKPIQAD